LSIAAGGIFYNVPPGTAARFYLKDEVKNFAWLYSSAGTVADSELQPKLTTSCPNNAKPLVVCRFFITKRYLFCLF